MVPPAGRFAAGCSALPVALHLYLPIPPPVTIALTKNVWASSLDILGQAVKTPDFLHGTLDTLILKALADEARHGYDIVRRIESLTSEAVRIEDGSLYPALYRLEKKRLIRGDWGVSDAGRRARFYRLTDTGRRRLADLAAEWQRFSVGVSRMLNEKP